MNDKKKEQIEVEPHQAARPLVFFKDKDGNGWLCDKGKQLDQDRDLHEQGCWRCDEMAFPTGGR